MSAAARFVRLRLGRRGQWLVIWGLGWIAYGYGTVAEPQTDRRGLALVTTWAPLHCWAWVWIGSGVLALVCAAVRPPWDWPGFYLATIPPLVWSISYFTSGATADLARGPYAGGLWLVIAAGVLNSSRTREHSVPHSRKPRGR